MNLGFFWTDKLCTQGNVYEKRSLILDFTASDARKGEKVGKKRSRKNEKILKVKNSRKILLNSVIQMTIWYTWHTGLNALKKPWCHGEISAQLWFYSWERERERERERHRADLRGKDSSKPAYHFKGMDHTEEDMGVVVIEEVKGKDDLYRVTRERFWINCLGTYNEENRRK